MENSNIGDVHEGLELVRYTDKNDQILFSHPRIKNGEQIDIASSILSMWNYPDTNFYISCFSYFTAKDIIEKHIFHDKILEEKEWDSVLLILDTKTFVENIFKSLENYNPLIRKVKYFDYNTNQELLDVFSKSLRYKYQKEVRIVFNLTNRESRMIKRICENIVEIFFNKTKSVIIPTKDFRDGFYNIE